MRRTRVYAPVGAGELDLRQRSVEVGDDVVSVLDADRETQRALVDAEARTLLRRHAPVRGDRGVEHLAEEIAERGRRRRELQRVDESEGGRLRRVFEIERDDPPEEAAELPLGELVLRVVRETRIADASDLGMRREVSSDTLRGLALAANSQLERAHAADAEPRLVRWQIRTVEDG